MNRDDWAALAVAFVCFVLAMLLGAVGFAHLPL